MAGLMGACEYLWYFGIIEYALAKRVYCKINRFKLLGWCNASMGMDVCELVIILFGLLANCMLLGAGFDLGHNRDM